MKLHVCKRVTPAIQQTLGWRRDCIEAYVMHAGSQRAQARRAAHVIGHGGFCAGGAGVLCGRAEARALPQAGQAVQQAQHALQQHWQGNSVPQVGR